MKEVRLKWIILDLCLERKDYTFKVLHAKEVCWIIRDTNLASKNVALRIGMEKMDSWVKHYRGVDMPHERYVVQKWNENPIDCQNISYIGCKRKKINFGGGYFYGKEISQLVSSNYDWGCNIPKPDVLCSNGRN